MPSLLFACVISDAAMTVIGAAIVTFRIIPTTVPRLPMALLGFSAAQLRAETAFLTVWACHAHLLSVPATNRPIAVEPERAQAQAQIDNNQSDRHTPPVHTPL
jgi:hypothetical protein